MESRARASPEQFLTLIEFMQRHGDLARPQAAAQGRIRTDRLWNELGSLLNSVGGGVHKSIEKWKKVWADWKTKTKKKALLIKRHASGTGGGPHSRLTLTRLEERVLSVMGRSAVMGQDDIQERGLINTQSTEASQEQSQSILSLVHDEERIEIEQLDDTADNDVDLVPLSPRPGPSSAAPTALALGPHRNNNRQHRPPTPDTPPAAPAPAPTPAPAQRRVSPRPRHPHPPPPGSPPPAPGPRQPPAPEPRQPPAPATPSSATSTPRRVLRFRGRRTLTPFDRATTEFVTVERHRLQLEETRERNNHEREIERLNIEQQRVEVLRRITEVGDALLNYLMNRDDTARLEQTD